MEISPGYPRSHPSFQTTKLTVDIHEGDPRTVWVCRGRGTGMDGVSMLAMLRTAVTSPCSGLGWCAAWVGVSEQSCALHIVPSEHVHTQGHAGVYHVVLQNMYYVFTSCSPPLLAHTFTFYHQMIAKTNTKLSNYSGLPRG